MVKGEKERAEKERESGKDGGQKGGRNEKEEMAKERDKDGVRKESLLCWEP